MAKTKSQDDLALALSPGQMTLVLKSLIPEHEPILIKGHPGVGKTDIVKQAVKDLKADCLICHPVVDEPTDYKGIPWVTKDKTTKEEHAEFLTYGNLRKMIEAKRLMVVFLDDFGQAVPTVQAAAMQLLLAREINGKPISPHVTFIAATNFKSDRAGVTGLLEPVKSRFTTILHLQPNHTDWIEWALVNDMPMPLISFMNYKPTFLTSFEATSDITNTPCPRTIANLGRLMNIGMPDDIEFQIFAGAAGQGFAIEFAGFLRLVRHLPDPELALQNPDSVKIPTEPDIRHALTSVLAEKIAMHKNKATFPIRMRSFCRIAERLPAEFAMFMMTMATKRNPKIMETKEYINWLANNQDIML